MVKLKSLNIEIINSLSNSNEVQYKHFNFTGSGCGSVGKAVNFDTRSPRFESSYRQNLLNIYLLSTVLKRQNKEKRDQKWPIFKKKHFNFQI